MDPETMKILTDNKIVRTKFANKVYTIFQSTKNVDYLLYVLNSKYGKSPVSNEYRAKELYLVDFYTKVHKFWIAIADRSNYTDTNVWDAVKILNSKFIKYACQHIEYKYKESKSYSDTILDTTVLYQPGFENLNKNIIDTRKWGQEHLDPSPIIKTAEEAEAEYYGYEYATSDVVIALKKKIKNTPIYSHPFRPHGTPFMINRKPKLDVWNKFNNALASVDREFQPPRDMDGTYELEAPVYGHKFPAKYSK